MTTPSVLVPLPCPFCGSAANRYKEVSTWTDDGSLAVKGTTSSSVSEYVRCSNNRCYARLAEHLWNNRAMIATAKEETPPDVQKIIRIIDWVMVTEEKMQAQADGDYVDDNEIDDNNNALSNLRKQLPAIRAALVSQSKDGWQDINTAPKDGTKILLLCPYKTENSGMRIGHEQPKIVIGRWVIPDLTDKKYHCINVHKKKLMQRHGGFWSAHFKGVQALAGQPTYWQSLPAAPVEGE